MANAKPADIPALTGLRAIAALSVVIAHASHLIPSFLDLGTLAHLVGSVAGFGMTLFFVLSGFVIHYNYREIIAAGGPENYWRFFVARFSRLYPLYFFLIVGEFIYRGSLDALLRGDPAITGPFLVAAPHYLTLTQTWIYGIVGENNLIYQFGPVASIAWSISTEWFFYLGYVLICPVIVSIRGTWMKIGAAVFFCCFAIAALVMLNNSLPSLQNYALHHYGPVATYTQESFFRWAFYFSPYSRITEFILGVFACAIFFGLQDRAITRRELLLGRLLGAGAVAALLILHILMFGPGRQSHPLLAQFHMCFGYAIPVAVLMFCLARYGGALARILSARPVLLIGEISYSMYLLHMTVIAWLGNHGLMQWAVGSGLRAAAAIGLITASIICLSLISYRLVERPARDWFRKTLSSPRRQPSGLAGRSLAAFSRALALAAFVLLPFGLFAFRPPLVTKPDPDLVRAEEKLLDKTIKTPTAGTIEIVEATYGRNCGAKPGNVSDHVARMCSAEKSCSYIVSVNRIGDPAGGCAKSFDVQWRCMKAGPIRHSEIPPEAGSGGKKVLLACE